MIILKNMDDGATINNKTARNGIVRLFSLA
jgi:hypothetical protein